MLSQIDRCIWDVKLWLLLLWGKEEVGTNFVHIGIWLAKLISNYYTSLTVVLTTAMMNQTLVSCLKSLTFYEIHWLVTDGLIIEFPNTSV